MNDGKLTSLSTKETSKSAAKKFIEEFEANFQNLSADSLIEKTPSFKRITLRNFADAYIDFKSVLHSPKYVRDIKYTFNLLTKRIGDETFINQIRFEEAEQFIVSIYKKANYAAALYLRVLKTAFNKAMAWEYISENPFIKIKLPRIPRKIPAFLDSKTLNKILKQTDSRLYKDIFVTAFLTGLRLGELTNLKWSCIDIENQIIFVRNTEEVRTKNKSDRIIPINPELKTILKRRFLKVIATNRDEYVFWRVKGVKLDNDTVSRKFKKIVRAAELDAGLHFHSLRHSFASMLAQKGVSLKIIQELLGHKDIQTTQIYSHLIIDNLSTAVNKISIKRT